MQWTEQGTIANHRYTVVPRSLILITHGNDLLLLRGAPDKRLWPNRLNGIGGHLEADEGLIESARREIREETGLEVAQLALRGLIHIGGQPPDPGVLLLVFTARALSREAQGSPEGTLEWHALDALPYAEMVDDLPLLLSRLFGPEASPGLLFGHYQVDAQGTMHYHLDSC